MRCQRLLGVSWLSLVLVWLCLSSWVAGEPMTPADLLPIYRTTLVELRLKVSIGLAELRNSERRLLPLQVALENQELKLNEVENLLESLEARLRD